MPLSLGYHCLSLFDISVYGNFPDYIQLWKTDNYRAFNSFMELLLTPLADLFLET